MINRRDFNKGALAAAVIGPTILVAKGVSAAPRTLTLLHTNDTHSRMEPFESGKFKGRGGVARRASLIRRVKKENPATLVLDAGDTFQGTPWFNTFQGEVDIRAMRAMGYDATCIGNHDFDAGVDTLAKDLTFAPEMATLSANYALDPSCPLRGRVKPNKIIERGGVKVGIFAVGIAFEGLVNPRFHKGVSYTDPVAAAKDQVTYLRDSGCEVVIALSHLGYKGRGGEPGDSQWPELVAGVDYVVGGHTHTFLKEPTMVAHSSGWRTAVMQVGHSGINVGRADLTIGAGGRAMVRAAKPLGVGGRAIA